MPYLTRDERIALQDDDRGEPSDQVHVRRGSKVTHYHDDADCRTLASAASARQMTRQTA